MSSSEESSSSSDDHDKCGSDGGQVAIRLPHLKRYKTKFKFVCSGEPAADDEPEEPNPTMSHDAHWDSKQREKWELHSALGPNLRPEGRLVHVPIARANVNPIDYDYAARVTQISLDQARAVMNEVKEATSVYEDSGLQRTLLRDDFQQLFLDIVLKHAEAVLQNARKVPLSQLHDLAPSALPRVKPLRLMLLGTAGTGKSYTIQTTLQELRRIMAHHGYEGDFFRVAAPTGTAAFNIRFNATTVHRMIHWLNLRSDFAPFRAGSEELATLQAAFEHTRIIFIDEISMIGRQFMGKIDSRTTQAKGGPNVHQDTLGGMSCVCIGDPAQCEAMRDQQCYDMKPHHGKSSDNARDYSNAGLAVYQEFDTVVILSKVHRLHVQELDRSQTNPDEIAANESMTGAVNSLKSC